MSMGIDHSRIVYASRMGRFAADLSILEQAAHIQSVTYFMCRQDFVLPFSLTSLQRAMATHVMRMNTWPDYLIIPSASGWLDSETSMPEEEFICALSALKKEVSASSPDRPHAVGEIFGRPILTDAGTSLVQTAKFGQRFAHPCLVCVDPKDQITDMVAIFRTRAEAEDAAARRNPPAKP